MNKILISIVSSAFLFASAAENADPYLWLEDINGAEALNWVKQRNEKSVKLLTGDARYTQTENEIREIITARDRIPSVSQMGGKLYNFWQDQKHVQGILRVTSPQEFRQKVVNWKTVIDFDKLSKVENKRWVYKGIDCLEPQYELCLVSMSDGGKDASVFREFNLQERKFVKNGFSIPEAKTGITWVDRNTLLVGSDFGPSSQTDSGYARKLKLWKRGTRLLASPTIFEISAKDMGTWPAALGSGKDRLIGASRNIDFYNQEFFILKSQRTFVKLNLPTDVLIHAGLKNEVVLSRQSAWKLPQFKIEIPAGTLISIPLDAGLQVKINEAKIIWQPTPRSSLVSFSQTKDFGVLVVNDNIKAKLYFATQENSQWQLREANFPSTGDIGISSTSSLNNTVYVSFVDFLTPPSLYEIQVREKKSLVMLLKSKAAVFDSSQMQAEQHFAISKDGVEIPYFLIKKANTVLDGSTPTILYGYGGFQDSQTPFYLGHTGKGWIEKGGAYAVANIRGGGEFGPAWHQAALKEKRQTAYNDFYAISESLIAKKVTSPRHLGIYGGSNGGLLVGVAATQRPNLFNAVACAAPLLDMLRFHKLLAGNSWVGEYGNPDVPEERAYIEKYSPYQNVFAGKNYPEIFFTGSTADDRVHPGHARKMAAKLEGLGYPVLFFENTEGGHSGAANLEQRIKMEALRRVYFWQKLSD